MIHGHLRSPARDARGFSLLEAVVAAALVAGSFAALAEMYTLSLAGNASARGASTAVVMAAQKMEELRQLKWDDAALAAGGNVADDASGYVEYLDQSGDVVGSGDQAPPGAQFVRRWSIGLVGADADALVLDVFVRPLRSVGVKPARVTTLRTRRTP
jgi:hypothetical protein